MNNNHNQNNIYIDLPSITTQKEETKYEEVSFASILKRQHKSLSQKFILLDINCRLDTINKTIVINANIIGSTNKEYKLQFKFKRFPSKMLYYSCSCMDFEMRDVDCKHLYWFGRNIFDKLNPDKWKIVDLVKTFVKYINYDIFPIGRNDKCPICMEEINYDDEKTINCYNQCRNSVHSLCWARYIFTTTKFDCVICRSELGKIFD